MKRWLAVVFLLASVACATARPNTGYDGFEADVIQVPLLQILNKNYYEANVWITDGRKIASAVRGLTGDVLIALDRGDIRPDGQVWLTVALSSGPRANMMPIVYQPGRKMHLDINNLFSTSQAW